MDLVVEVEKGDGDLYYPKVTEVIIDRQMPYEIDNSTVKIVDPYSAIDNISLYDEVNILLDDTVIFSGRLDKKNVTLSPNSNNIVWSMTDHGQVLDYIKVSTVKSWTSSTAIGTILEDLRSSFISSDLTGTNISTGPNVTAYNIPAWSKSLLTCFRELAEVGDYNLFVDWDKDIHFEAKPTTPKEGINVIEGNNLFSLNSKDEDITAVRNYVKVIGDTGFSAVAQDATSQTKYHKREFVYTDPSLGSNNACQELADAILTIDPPESIDVSIAGEININPGDLLSLDIPTYSIAGDYEVSSITHLIGVDDFETNLELGTKRPNLSRILLGLGKNVERINAGFL